MTTNGKEQKWTYNSDRELVLRLRTCRDDDVEVQACQYT